MELVKGQIVASRQGRDVTHFYMVAGFEGERVLLADGQKRPLSAPKAKNPRHLNATSAVLTPGEAETDQELRAALKAYESAHRPQQQGG